MSSARLSLWNFHSGNTECKASPWEVWSTGAPSTTTLWTSQPAWNSRTATSTETRGNSACSSAPDGWINADATSLVQSWAAAIKNKSYTWSGADNLRRHFSGHRPATRISKTYNAQLGDIVFFKWKKEQRYNHAAVVTSKVQGRLGLSQHGTKNHTTLNDVLARYRGTSNPIQRVLIIRPRSAR